jgi:type VI secretion system protein ImpM
MEPHDVATDDGHASLAPSLAWFGKLPSAGDFVSRHMPYSVQQYWDRWCADGMEALKASSSASGLEVWGSTPCWAFVLPAQPGIATGQLGVIAPSCDRVGRIFPFIVTAAVPSGLQALLLSRAALLGLAWGRVVAQAQETRQSIDLVDSGLQAALAQTLSTQPMEDGDGETTLPRGINPSSLPWPQLGQNFDLQGNYSHWWSVPPNSTGFQSRTHTGNLNTMHFLSLCC